jgi:hypothetical protein
MIRQPSVYGPIAEVRRQRWGLIQVLADAGPEKVGLDNCNLRIGLQNAAIFRL